MPRQTNGGPAFPRAACGIPEHAADYGEDGMTLRDWFAGQALAGLPALMSDSFDTSCAQRAKVPLRLRRRTLVGGSECSSGLWIAAEDSSLDEALSSMRPPTLCKEARRSQQFVMAPSKKRRRKHSALSHVTNANSAAVKKVMRDWSAAFLRQEIDVAKWPNEGRDD